MIGLPHLGGTFDYETKRSRLDAILESLNDPEVWDDRELSQKLNQERSSLEKTINLIQLISNRLQDAEVLFDLAINEDDQDTLKELTKELQVCDQEIGQLEVQRMFSGEMDTSNAFLDIQAGSGGTEAQDWANMLLRMYLRWCESNGFKADLIETSAGEVAGIKSATIHISGDFAFGWLRTETGVHRLVRKSPFDSGNRRHTSFAAVFVSPEIEDNFEIDLDPSDLRIDVYRASGAGGQHVNVTDSAVRITHIPTGIVTSCQNERSQHQNRDRAMQMLAAKLLDLERQRRDEQIAEISGEQSNVDFGSQIRSYVLHPYQMVKDLRTDFEIGDVTRVLDGDLDGFIESFLRWNRAR